LKEQLEPNKVWGFLPSYGRYEPAGLLRVTGADAGSFLQGQCTQELRPAVAPEVVYGLWLNVKGKVVADSHVLRIGPEEWWLCSTDSPGARIQERLEAYVIADDVVIEELTPDWAAAVLAGPEGRAWWSQQGVHPPGPGELVRVAGGYGFVGRRGTPDTWELLWPRASGLGADWPEASRGELERHRIRAGIAAVPRDVGEADLPNEAGLDAVAISFTKGCYLGQEVMARLKAMGRVRRSLWRVAERPAAVPSPGAALYQGDRAVGELRSVIDDGQDGWMGLAMLSRLNLDVAAPLSLAPGAAPGVALQGEVVP
jgi:tRNA-modifying protein YgfZ